MQKKRKVATMPVVMVVFFICLSAGIACGASDLESSYTSQGGFIPGQFRLTPFDYATGDFKTNSDRTFSYAEHYPFIRKTDLRGGYADSYRNPTSDNFDHGLSGRPVYLTDDGGELNGFIIPEIADVRAEKQIWEGNLTRYDFVRRPDMTVDRPKKWDLQSELNYFTNLQNLSTRNLSFWHRQNTGRDTSNARLVEHILDPQKQRPTGTAFNVEKMYGRGTQDDKTNYLLYPTNASNTNINLSALMGLATVGTDWKSDIKFPSTSNKFYVHPSHWMLAWMAGRDSRITNPGGFNKPNDGGARKMVPDLGQAVFGHIAHRDKRYVFAHTNDGLLHMIDDAAGNVSGSREVMAFMPPQVLYGKRLMQQKFDFRTSTSMTSARIGDNKLKTVVSANAWLPAGQAYPGFLTDGAVIARRLYTKSDGLKNVTHTGIYSKGTGSQNLKPHVFGLMGRGGAGMYLLRMDDYADTGEKDKLHLEWAMENDMYRYLSDTHEPVSTYLAAT